MSNRPEKLMTVNNLSCIFNMPLAVPTRKQADGTEVLACLPPHKEIDPYVVDEYPACPANWMHGSSKASSYFVPVEEGKGMWLDFNSCASHTHDVAVVLSIQGINPITGQKQDKMRLERYQDKCPVHNCDFQQDRFCPECKIKWPAHNYLATTGTPSGYFWLDGFRNADGSVRQYIFTAEEMKGIASQIIGKDRVFAIGIAFYLSKNPKSVANYEVLRASCDGGGACAAMEEDTLLDTSSYVDVSHHDRRKMIYGPSGLHTPSGEFTPPVFFGPTHTPQRWLAERDAARGLVNYSCDGIKMKSFKACVKVDEPVVQKQLEIGAGAQINQEIYVDPEDISYWQDEPSGFIYVNYATAEEVQRILAAGKREEKKEGFMEGLKVGN